MIIREGAKTRLVLRGVGVLLAAGIVGGLAGATLDRFLLSKTLGPRELDGPPVMPAPPDRGFPDGSVRLPRSFERLGLSEAQRNQITTILEASQPKVDSIMAAMLPALRAARESVQIAIEEVLTADQRRLLEEEFTRHPPWGPRGGWGGPGERRRNGPVAPGNGPRRPRRSPG